jgi:hypothetical protein
VHRVFVFLRPDANEPGSGNHLYIEHCAPEEELKGHCGPPLVRPTATAAPAARVRPHPGHIHSDP